MTSVVAPCAFVNLASLPFAMLADRRQEYLPALWPRAGSGTDVALVDSFADGRRYEMMFERAAPSCYPYGRFSASAELRSSTGKALDVMPAEDMHRAVSKVSLIYAEICGTAERIVASSPRELGHGNEADGMSAGG